MGAASEESDARPRLGETLRGPGLGDARRIFDAFLNVARQRPAAPALVERGRTYTYGELERLTRALALQLRARVRTGEVVAIHGTRDARTVVAMLASLRAARTFTVLDAAYPPRRLAQLLGELPSARLLLLDATPDDERAVLAFARAEAVLSLALDAGHEAGHEPAHAAAHAAGQAAGHEAGDEADAGARVDDAAASAIAYVLFTSGTTGVPKGIQTTHAPLVHFVDWYTARFDVGPASRFSMLSGLAHDPILRDVFVPLSVGAELHIPEAKLLVSPVELFRWLDGGGVTHVHATPQLFSVLVTGRPPGATLPRARYLFSGGDSLRRARALALLDAAPGATVVNFYGATETPQAMSHHVFDPADEHDPVPIGKGIADAQVLVLDAAGAVADVGAVGEVAIRTRYLSAGYLNDADQTRRKFRRSAASAHGQLSETSEASDDRLYLTGDLGFFRPDGAVVVTGRADDQVKVRGFRVELGEIARQLERLPDVRAAIVLPDPTAHGETRLVAYVVGSGDTASLQAALAAAVPPYMVPALYVWLPTLPLLPNGKIDRARLHPPALAAGAGVAPPDGPVETAIVEHWKHLLGLPAIDTATTFVELGGDSLSSIAASVHLESLLGTLPDRWERRPIQELATLAAARPAPLAAVDTSVLMRAVSIFLVVSSHFGVLDVGGSTAALLVVAGLSFARYQLNAVMRAQSIAPVLRSVFKIALPTVLYTLALELAFSSPKWPSLLLVSNFIGPDFDGGLGYWFIDVLVQNQLLLAALLSLGAVRRLAARWPFAFAWTLWLFATLAMLLMPFVWSAEPLFNRVPHMTLWLLLTGWALAKAETPARKALCVVSALAAMELTTMVGGLWFMALVLVILAGVPRVRLPRVMAAGINVVAGASLFIYLTHFQTRSVVRKIHALDRPAINIAVALVAGIVAWKAWDELRALTARRAWRLRPAQAMRAAGSAGGAAEL